MKRSRERSAPELPARVEQEKTRRRTPSVCLGGGDKEEKKKSDFAWARGEKKKTRPPPFSFPFSPFRFCALFFTSLYTSDHPFIHFHRSLSFFLSLSFTDFEASFGEEGNCFLMSCPVKAPLAIVADRGADAVSPTAERGLCCCCWCCPCCCCFFCELLPEEGRLFLLPRFLSKPSNESPASSSPPKSPFPCSSSSSPSSSSPHLKGKIGAASSPSKAAGKQTGGGRAASAAASAAAEGEEKRSESERDDDEAGAVAVVAAVAAAVVAAAAAATALIPSARASAAARGSAWPLEAAASTSGGSKDHSRRSWAK